MSNDRYWFPKFKCKNINCTNYNLESKIGIWDSQLEKQLPLCEICKESLEIVLENNTSIPFIGEFSNLSRQDKQKNLKQRSHKHFKTNIIERKNWMDKNYKP